MARIKGVRGGQAARAAAAAPGRLGRIGAWCYDTAEGCCPAGSRE